MKSFVVCCALVLCVIVVVVQGTKVVLTEAEFDRDYAPHISHNTNTNTNNNKKQLSFAAMARRFRYALQRRGPSTAGWGKGPIQQSTVEWRKVRQTKTKTKRKTKSNDFVQKFLYFFIFSS